MPVLWEVWWAAGRVGRWVEVTGGWSRFVSCLIRLDLLAKVAESLLYVVAHVLLDGAQHDALLPLVPIPERISLAIIGVHMWPCSCSYM